MSIPAMFAQHGEPYFRAREKEAVHAAASRSNAVIATGGGTVKDPENTAALRKNGILVALTADVDIILQRTAAHGTRPVLDSADGGDRRAAVVKLLEERRRLYEDADITVDTSGRSPLEVTERILPRRIFAARHARHRYGRGSALCRAHRGAHRLCGRRGGDRYDSRGGEF